MRPKPNTVFECDVCSRCGGTGEYSFNQMDGTRCYGCNGTGWSYTKRGKAAREFYRKSLTKRADELRVGDQIVYIKSVHTIRNIVIEGDRINVECDWFSNKGAADGCYDIAWTDVERAEKLAAAVAYQETLNKAGKPKKA